MYECSSACVYVHHVSACCSVRPEEGLGSHGTGATNGDALNVARRTWTLALRRSTEGPVSPALCLHSHQKVHASHCCGIFSAILEAASSDGECRLNTTESSRPSAPYWVLRQAALWTEPLLERLRSRSHMGELIWDFPDCVTKTNLISPLFIYMITLSVLFL